jgi:zinc D-Ala-D-Ala carboxypeptidase
MRLTKSFNLIEFTSSETASRRGINNTPNESVIANLKLLCEKVLQPLRDQYGKPINVTSGYRSVALNKAIGGSSNSQHTRGQAVDIQVPRQDYLTVFNLLRAMETDQIIWEFGDAVAPQWLHISYVATGNRMQVLRAKKNALRQTVYVPF